MASASAFTNLAVIAMTRDVCCWHDADVPACPRNVRYRRQSGRAADRANGRDGQAGIGRRSLHLQRAQDARLRGHDVVCGPRTCSTAGVARIVLTMAMTANGTELPSGDVRSHV